MKMCGRFCSSTKKLRKQITRNEVNNRMIQRIKTGCDNSVLLLYINVVGEMVDELNTEHETARSW